MQQQYFEVPGNILTGKDLDYLSDMFQWNYGALKKVNYFIENVGDQEIKEVLQESFTLFDNNLHVVLDVLSSQGGGSFE